MPSDRELIFNISYLTELLKEDLSAIYDVVCPLQKVPAYDLFLLSSAAKGNSWQLEKSPLKHTFDNSGLHCARV